MRSLQRLNVVVRNRRFLIGLLRLAAPVLTLTACSFTPLRQASSLSPAVRADTLAYNDAIGDAADRILLTNILRAMDGAPLNLSQLSSLSGSLSLQGTLGFTLPWGKAVQSGNPISGQNSATPSITGSTTPTYTMTPLNTQAFMISILQPISSAYVLNRWQVGLPRELLLRLFVKEIDVPDDKVPGGVRRFINDADDTARLASYTNLVDKLISANAQLKAFDVLDPVGPPFSLYAAATSSGMAPATRTVNADSSGFGIITGSNDVQYHVGNVLKTSVTLTDGSTASVENGGQLYRVYAGQVALCIDAATFQTATNIHVPSLNPPASLSAGIQRVGKGVVVNYGMYLNSYSMMSSPSAGSGSAAIATKPASSGAPASPSGSQAVTAALQAGRVSSVVDSAGCGPDEIVLVESDENSFADESKGFIHIQWRSVSEIFDYLGAVLRTHADASSYAFFNAVADPSIEGSSSGSTDVLFSVHKTLLPSGALSVKYNGDFYRVDESRVNGRGHNYTMTILSMLNILVDLSSQPSIGASSSQPLRLLPIP